MPPEPCLSRQKQGSRGLCSRACIFDSDRVVRRRRRCARPHPATTDIVCIDMSASAHSSRGEHLLFVQMLPKGGPQSLLCVFGSCTAASRGTFRSRYRHTSFGSLSVLNADALVGISASTIDSTVLHGPAPSLLGVNKSRWQIRFAPAAAGWIFSCKCGSSVSCKPRGSFALVLMDKLRS